VSRDRIEASYHLCQEMRCPRGEIFGRYLDRELYALMMSGDPTPFLDLAGELAASFVRNGTRIVVVDGWQLYSPAHDIWHLTVRAAAAAASRSLGRPVLCLDYQIMPQKWSMRDPGQTWMRSKLSVEAIERKLALVNKFPGIADDMRQLMAFRDHNFIEEEILSEVRPIVELIPAEGEVPLYELFGAKRVAEGVYAETLRYQHIEPIMNALVASIKIPSIAA